MMKASGCPCHAVRIAERLYLASWCCSVVIAAAASAANGSSVTYTEGFESGYTLGAELRTHADWFYEEGNSGPSVEAGIGVAGSQGLTSGDRIFTWVAHPFDWNDPDFAGIDVQMDFETSSTGGFDDDRLGWMISNTDDSSSNIFGVQLDPGGADLNIEGYWDGVTSDDRRPHIVDLPPLSSSTWYRFRVEVTKLTATSAGISVSLTELDAGGNPVSTIATGSITDTSLMGDDAPNSKYFTAACLWPGYKNYTGATGDADNVLATIHDIVLDTIRITPDYIGAVVGSAAAVVSVAIPPGSNNNTDVQVTLTTDDAGVAVPAGATGGSLVLTFAQGGATQQDVGIDIGSVGIATITTTNDAGLEDDTLTVNVGSGAVTFAPASVVALEGTRMPVEVSISAGSNDTRSVEVTLTTDDAAVVVPVGASGGSLVLTFAAGAAAQQVVDLDFGVSGAASITSTNDGGLDDAVLPVHVSTGFNFTVSADPRDKITQWDNVLAAINSNVGGPGIFHLSAGDIDPLQPLRDKIDVRFGPSALWYPGIGNHEMETPADMTWLRNEYNNGNGVRTPLKNFTNQDGPASTVETTYTWDYGDAHFIMLNEYWDGTSDTGTDGDVVPALYDWLAADLAANSQPVVFVFGHEPAFPFNRHVGNSLDKYPANRDAFWNLLETEGVQAYFCGHTHVYKRYQPNPDGTWQIDVGNAGNVSDGYPDGHTFANVTVGSAEVRYDIWRNISGNFALEDTWTVLIGLKIGLSTSAIDRTVDRGQNLPDDVFTVGAVGPGTLHYTINDDAAWLSVSPDSGDVTSQDPDPIDIIYDVSGLPAGQHQATVTVSSPDAVNSPQTIVVTVTVEGPSIVLSDSVIDRTVFIGDDLPNDIFTVANGGPDTLNYTIGDDAGWLSVSPDAGASTGEADPIEVVYDVAGLSVDQHTAVISVSSTDAGNSPQTITVNLTVETVSPDFDHDGDVDQEDFGHLQICLTGTGTPQNDPACLDARLDDDTDVDVNDFATFQACMSGANVRAEPTCDD